ncbi:uncharacterized protein LOC134191929 isoform X2 [Corticium candelabrum]|uniref:uncharacterized protein LOC134191929 isoform X2 n=1 Tax=Corticium candelabrum TaxID=121492 RepID=UPI002E264E3E|nr:uncharacterized protein LOC134191929 isoform X2 [Corticium candelabrum]
MSQDKLRIDFSPSGYPVFGGESILITVCGHDSLPDRATSLFVEFEGTEQKHVSAAYRINGSTLQASIPGHDRAEEVTLRVGYENSDGFCSLASGVFTYRLDPTHCIAEFLADSTKSAHRLRSLSRVDFSSSDVSTEARAVFDEKLTHSFERLSLPNDWTLCCSHDEQQETLLHFSARLGLSKFIGHLMKLPGAVAASTMRNLEGELPVDVARSVGNEYLVNQLCSLMKEMQDDTNHECERKKSVSFDEDEILLAELNGIMSTESQRRMSSIISSVSNSEESPGQNSLVQTEDAIYRSPHQTTMRPFSCTENVFSATDENFQLDLSIERPSSASADRESSEMNENHLLTRRKRRSRSADPSPICTVSSLEESLIRLKKFKQELEHLKEKNLQIIKAAELGQFSVSCPSLAEEPELTLRRPIPLSSILFSPSSGSTPDLSTTTQTSSDKVKASPLLGVSLNLYERDVESDHESSLSSLEDETTESHRGSSIDANEEDTETVESVVSDVLEQIVNRVVVNVETEMVFNDELLTVGEDIETVVVSVVDAMIEQVVHVSDCEIRLSTLTSTNVDDIDINDLDEISEEQSGKMSVTEDLTSLMTEGSTACTLSDISVNDHATVDHSQHSNVMASSDTNDDDEQQENINNVDADQIRKRSRSLSLGSASEVSVTINAHLVESVPEGKDEIDGQTYEKHSSPAKQGHRRTQSLSSPVVDISSVGLEFDNADMQTEAVSVNVDINHELPPNYCNMNSENRETGDSAPTTETDGTISQAILMARQSMPAKFLFDNGSSAPASPAERDFLQKIRQGEDEPELEEELIMQHPGITGSSLDFDVSGERRPTLVNTLKVEELGVLKSSSSPEVRVNQQERLPDSGRASPFTREHNRPFQIKKLSAGREETQESASDSESTNMSYESHGYDMETKSDIPKRRFTFLRRKEREKEKEKNKSQLLRKGSKVSMEGDRDANKHRNRQDDDRLVARRQTVSTSHEHPGAATVSRVATFSAGSPTGRAKKVVDNRRLQTSKSSVIPSKPDYTAFAAGSLAHSKHVSKSQGSLDSLLSHDDDDRETLSDLVNDPELALIDEPDNWQSIVDKKAVKKHSKKEVIRQERIYELILTERRHLRTVKVMRLLFGRGMIHRARMQTEAVDEMMPDIDKLDNLATEFCGELIKRQRESIGFVVGSIGDILVKQFTGKHGSDVKAAYASFCGRHTEAVEKFKEHYRTNKLFRTFINKCSVNPMCRRLDFAGHVLLITQRLGKYNVLLEAILKSTKDSKEIGKEIGKEEYRNIQAAWEGLKEISEHVDKAVRDRQQRLRLQALQTRLEIRIQWKTNKSVRKVKNLNLLANNSRLLYENGEVMWKGSGDSAVDVHVVLTTRLLILLVEKDNDKFNIAMLQDKKPPVIPLHQLMQRSNAADLRALYLISTGRNPEMYPLVWSTKQERDRFCKVLKAAIDKFSKAAATDEPDGFLSSESDDKLPEQPEDSKSVASGGSLGSPPPAYESEGESTSERVDATPHVSEQTKANLEQQREKVNELMRQLESKDLQLDNVLRDKAILISEIRSLTGDSGDSDSVDSSRDVLISATKQITDQISQTFEARFSGGDFALSPRSCSGSFFPRDSIYSVQSQGSGSDIETTNSQTHARSVGAVGYRSVSVEPDSNLSYHVASSTQTSTRNSRNGQDSQLDFLPLPLSVKGKKRPSSQGSADGMDRKVERALSSRRTSAPESPRRRNKPPSTTIAGVSCKEETVDSEDLVSQGSGREEMTAITRLAQTVDTILGKMSEQETEIERLRVELSNLKSEQSLKTTSLHMPDERSSLIHPAVPAVIQEISLSRTPSGASTKSVGSPSNSPRASPRSLSPSMCTDVGHGSRRKAISKKKTDARSPLQTNSDVS